MKAETRVMFLHTKECWRLPATHHKRGERQGTDASSQPLKEPTLPTPWCGTSSLLELWDNEFLMFKPPSPLCYGSPRKEIRPNSDSEHDSAHAASRPCLWYQLPNLPWGTSEQPSKSLGVLQKSLHPHVNLATQSPVSAWPQLLVQKWAHDPTWANEAEFWDFLWTWRQQGVSMVPAVGSPRRKGLQEGEASMTETQPGMETWWHHLFN